MKYFFTISFLFLVILKPNPSYSQNKYYPNNTYIEVVDFRGDGVFLKLTLAGIKYGKKLNGAEVLAKYVVDSHKKMAGGKTDIKLNLMRGVIFRHCTAYNLDTPSTTLVNRHANPINVNYWELML